MESANLQEFFVGYSSLVSAPTTASITHDSTSNIIFDGNTYNPYLEDQNIPCSRENIENQWFNFSSNYQTNEQQLPSLYFSIKSPPNYGGFQAIEAGSINTNGYNNHVFSSTNSRSCGTNSTLDLLSSSSFSNSMGFNLQDHHHHHLDLLSATDYSDGLLRNNALFGYGHQQNMQHSINYSPSNSSNKASTVTRAKRPVNSFSEPKKSNVETKKSCSISRSSCPPLKIRKEKLGDRISALQRLVAPFGKTDTSSVLTEAIGYIQFLHDQVETLSMPYLKSSQRKPYQKLQSGSIQEDETRPRQDLTSRGLCLMPLSCISFIHGCD